MKKYIILYYNVPKTRVTRTVVTECAESFARELAANRADTFAVDIIVDNSARKIAAVFA